MLHYSASASASSMLIINALLTFLLYFLMSEKLLIRPCWCFRQVFVFSSKVESFILLEVQMYFVNVMEMFPMDVSV